MKKLLSVCFALLSAYSFAKDGFKVIKSDANSVTLEYTLSGFGTQTTPINGANYSKFFADDCVPVLNAGFPQVLRSSVSLALPKNAVAKTEIISFDYVDMQNIQSAPSKGSLTRNIDPQTVPYVFGSVYQKNEFYPKSPTELNPVYNLRGQNGVPLSVFPVQVNPVTKTVRVYNKLVIKVTYVSAKGAKVNLTLPEFTSNEEKELFSNRFINIDHNISTAKVAYTPMNEFGSMLVICHPGFTNNIQPLVDWKNQKGIKTTLVSSATTGTTAGQVQAYIQSYYASNPNLLYVLLVGDHEQINSYNAGTTGSETKWSDISYGFLSGNDYYPEIMVGRFSSSTSTDINVMVNRTLEYEKNPSSGTWYTTGIGIGSNQGYGIGDDGEPDWMHVRNIGNKLLGATYSQFKEFYDSTHGGTDAPGDPNSTMVGTAVNTGASIFIYCGHGAQNVCVTSNYSSTDIVNATNYGKYPFSIQVACNNGTFIGGTCLSEAFLRATGSGTLGPKGAIGSVGSSILMAWAEPMQTEDEIGDLISNQFANNKKYTLGGLFYCGQMSMLDDYPTTTGQEVMETWVMFGDPSCLFRSAVPTNITASHNSCIIPGATSFSFTSSFGTNAYACISQNNQILGTSQVTSGNTNIALTQTFNPSQNVQLTITQYNKTPYIVSLPACGPTGIASQINAENISVESLFKDELNIRYTDFAESNITVSLTDMQGRVVASQNFDIASPTGNVKIENLQLAPAVYIATISNSAGKAIKITKVVKQ